jgi:hypothetical protein
MAGKLPPGAESRPYSEDYRRDEIQVVGIGIMRRILLSCVAVLVAMGIVSAISPASLAAGQPDGAAQKVAAAAKALVKALAHREVSLNAAGSYQASAVIHASAADWLVLEGADGPIALNGSVTANPYPNGAVQIYRWSTGDWSLEGVVAGFFGPISGCCGISAEHLTGSDEPDFVLTGGGAADTVWTAMVSDIGGRWHQVLFDYGYTDTSVVNSGVIEDHGVLTNLDACSCALGPTTELFETYRDGIFRPAPPPGGSPPCSLSALRDAIGYRHRRPPTFSDFACADGWALAIDDHSGTASQAVGLFVASGPKWSVMRLDSGDSLGSDPWIYDIPLSLLEQLAGRLGPSLRPAVATGELIAQPAMIGTEYTGDVITADGADWFVAETASGSIEAPTADAQIYRWSGSEWVKVGQVDQVPVSLNYFQAITGLAFAAVQVSRSAAPGFTVAGSSPAAILTDVGGTWHVGV